VALRLERVAQATDEAHRLWDELVEGSGGVRGAAAIFENLGDFEAIVERGSLWLGHDEAPVSLAVLEGGIVKVLYVAKGHRRRGLGRATLAELLRQASPIDAWALPGDRASKSLYESVGWRARLLTMRGD
jgi:GNAT superfamily N-acetyltransferase